MIPSWAPNSSLPSGLKTSIRAYLAHCLASSSPPTTAFQPPSPDHIFHSLPSPPLSTSFPASRPIPLSQSALHTVNSSPSCPFGPKTLQWLPLPSRQSHAPAYVLQPCRPPASPHSIPVPRPRRGGEPVEWVGACGEPRSQNFCGAGVTTPELMGCHVRCPVPWDLGSQGLLPPWRAPPPLGHILM